MKIFLSWSGNRSRDVAAKLRTWLGDVIQAAEPWMSKEDISPGDIWFGAISDNILESSYGILCVTAENKEKPWLLWEAGALYRGFEDVRRVVPLLIDMDKSDIDQPLSNFQVISVSDKDDVLRMLKSINSELPRPLSKESLQKQLNLWWQDLQDSVAESIDDNPITIQSTSKCDYTFEDAAARFLKEPGKQQTSKDRDMHALRIPRVYIGELKLDLVNDDALRRFKADRSAGTIDADVQGKVPKAAAPSTVNKELRAISAILNRAATDWGWIEYAPRITAVPDTAAKKPYILDGLAQTNLFRLLPEYMMAAAIFGINTGVRKRIIYDLEWAWEKKIAGIDVPVFIVPRGYRGSKIPRTVFLNSIARRCVEKQRGKHEKYVFVGKRGGQFNFGKAWLAAWRQGGFPETESQRKGIENLRYTFEHRLTKAGIRSEDRNILLWNAEALKNRRHDQAEHQHLLSCVEKIADFD